MQRTREFDGYSRNVHENVLFRAQFADNVSNQTGPRKCRVHIQAKEPVQDFYSEKVGCLKPVSLEVISALFCRYKDGRNQPLIAPLYSGIDAIKSEPGSQINVMENVSLTQLFDRAKDGNVQFHNPQEGIIV